MDGGSCHRIHLFRGTEVRTKKSIAHLLAAACLVLTACDTLYGAETSERNKTLQTHSNYQTYTIIFSADHRVEIDKEGRVYRVIRENEVLDTYKERWIDRRAAESLASRSGDAGHCIPASWCSSH